MSELTVPKLITLLDKRNDEIAALQFERDALRVELAEAKAELMEQCRLLGMSGEREAKHLAQIEQLERERDALRAELAALKAQEPVAWANSASLISAGISRERGGQGDLHTWAEQPTTFHTQALYAHPVPAQSASEGWLRAVDEALVVTHLGVANPDDTYEAAKQKLDALIGWHCDVATDPAVNGGFRLVLAEPPPEKLTPSGKYDSQHYYAQGWNDAIDEALASAPKPEETK